MLSTRGTRTESHECVASHTWFQSLSIYVDIASLSMIYSGLWLPSVQPLSSVLVGVLRLGVAIEVAAVTGDSSVISSCTCTRSRINSNVNS